MANEVTGKVLGGQAKTGLTARKVKDVFSHLGLNGTYTATVNGEPAQMDDCLEDYNNVTFSPAVKGGKV